MSEFEGQDPIFWQSIGAGEFNTNLILASDGVRGTVLSDNSVCVDKMAVVGLQVTEVHVWAQPDL